MKNGSQEDIWRRYLICEVQEKSLSLLCGLMLQSVDHWSILESPKSSVIAAVGEADQQMLFAAQERGGITRAPGSTAELSMVLKPCSRVSTPAPYLMRKWSACFPTFTWLW